jgi:hypothetical protein
MVMTDSQLVSAPIVCRTFAFIAAGLLIFVGLVFQLGELLGSQLNATGNWLIHMVALNIWNALVLRMNALGFEEVLYFWPLLLVGLGLAILLALQPISIGARGEKRGE